MFGFDFKLKLQSAFLMTGCLALLHLLLLFFSFCLIPGVPEEQSAERRSHSEVQTEKDGDVSDAQQEDQERTAQSEPPNGVFASKDPRNREMTLASQLILENEWTLPLFDCYKKEKKSTFIIDYLRTIRLVLFTHTKNTLFSGDFKSGNLK